MNALFSPLLVRDNELANRITDSPMCQCSAADGVAQDWHLVQYGQVVRLEASLLVFEATAVESRGRVHPADLGLIDCVRRLSGPRLYEWGGRPHAAPAPQPSVIASTLRATGRALGAIQHRPAGLAPESFRLRLTPDEWG